MPFKLIVSAAYQKNGSTVKISVDGTYGFQLALKPTLGVVHITLIRLVKITSSGPVYVTTTLEANSFVEITRQGHISQDGPTSQVSPVIYSKKISNDSFIRAQVIVDLYRNRKLIASESVNLGPSNG